MWRCCIFWSGHQIFLCVCKCSSGTDGVCCRVKRAYPECLDLWKPVCKLICPGSLCSPHIALALSPPSPHSVLSPTQSKPRHGRSATRSPPWPWLMGTPAALSHFISIVFLTFIFSCHCNVFSFFCCLDGCILGEEMWCVTPPLGNGRRRCGSSDRERERHTHTHTRTHTHTHTRA